jgi:hypothetical protein
LVHKASAPYVQASARLSSNQDVARYAEEKRLILRKIFHKRQLLQTDGF